MALVVTIVVLIILATISIVLIMQGGILDQARYAKDLYEEKKEEEKATLDEAEENVDEYLGGIIIEINGKKVRLREENFGEYLGKKVTNYKPAGTGIEEVTIDSTLYKVSTTYRLYYIDFAGKYSDVPGTIYLKADDTSNKYPIPTTGNADTSKIRELNPHLYKDDTGNEIAPPSSDNPNMKAVTWLTDTAEDKWGKLVTSGNDTEIGNKVNYVVGAPSLEMMMDSYNAHYADEFEGDLSTPNYSAPHTEGSKRLKLFYQYPYDANRYGYGVGPADSQAYSTRTASYSVQSDTAINPMYYSENNGIPYWMASPSDNGSVGVKMVTAGSRNCDCLGV